MNNDMVNYHNNLVQFFLTNLIEINFKFYFSKILLEVMHNQEYSENHDL
jgi:hypothetical protein